MQDLEAKWILHLAKFCYGARAPKNVYIVCQPRRRPNISCKFWLTSNERRRCSKEDKTRNQLKFAGVPQTTEPLSAVIGPTFTLLWGYMEEILLFNKFFPECRAVNPHCWAPQWRHMGTDRSRPAVEADPPDRRPDNLVQWCADGDFLHNFCILYFQRAVCTAAHPRHAF